MIYALALLKIIKVCLFRHSGNTADRQILAVHVHHEHSDDLGDGDHHQLELQNSLYAQNARMGQIRLSHLSAATFVYEKTRPKDDAW